MSSPRENRNHALALIAEERFAEAEAAARACLAEERAPRAYVILGVALRRLYRNREALAAFDAALAIDPANKEARTHRAATLDRVGRVDEALAEFDALANLGAAADLYVDWAWCLVAAGREDDAAACLRQGLLRHRESVKLHEHLMKLRWMRGDGAAHFADDAQRALADAPGHHGLRLALVDALRRVGRVVDAEGAIADGLALAPGVAGFHLARASVLDDNDRLAEADAAVAAAHALAPDDVHVAIAEAHAKERLGDAARARAALAPHLARAPRDQMLLAYDSIAARMLGHADYARLCDYQAFVRAVDLAPPPGWTDIDSFNRDLAPRLEAQHRMRAHPIEQSVLGGTQTARDLLDLEDPVIAAFLILARDAVSAFARTLPRDPAHPFLAPASDNVRLAGAWSVFLRPGGRHSNHFHQKGWLSSAYYVRLPAETEGPQRAGWLKLGEPRKPIVGLGPERWVQPKPGRLVLFPSYMWHGTEPFADGERLTVAFDAVPA